MKTTLNYPAITERAEREIRAYLELAASHCAAEHVTGECIARGGAPGVLSRREGLVVDLDALLETEFQADRARHFALIHPDTASSTPR